MGTKTQEKKAAKAEEPQPQAVELDEAPGFVQDMVRAYQEHAAHAFILHHNVGDYVRGCRDLRNYLCELYGRRDVLAWYDPANGLTFGVEPGPAADKQMERMMTICGLSGPTSKDQQMLQNAGMNAQARLPREPQAAMTLLGKMLRTPPPDPGKEADATHCRTAVFINYAALMMPNAETARMSPQDRAVLVHLREWARDAEIADYGHVVVLICESITDLHPDLARASSRYHVVEVPMPDDTERAMFISGILAAEAGKPDPIQMGIEEAQFARMTAGLSRYHVETIMLRAKTRGAPVTEDLVRNEKRQIIRTEYGQVLELMEPDFGFEGIGGLEYAKTYFRKNVITPFRTGNKARMPQGILMLGPAGTGKSIMAQAVAKESGVNCAKLNMGSLRGKYVGESEAKLEAALRCIESLAPMIVFVDEIDQALRRSDGDGDGGVRMNEFRRLTEFMADETHRGRIVFLGASNRPDLLDPATKRKGRFDAKMLIDIPDDEERAHILRVCMRKYFRNGEEIGAKALATMVEKTNWWTGAEINGVTQKAFELYEDGDAKTVDEAFLTAIGKMRNRTQLVAEMRWAALEEIDDQDLLPPRMKNKDQMEAAKKAAETARAERAPRGTHSRREL